MSDNFQIIPHQVGDVAGNYEQPLGNRISNYNAWARGPRMSQDRTKTTFGMRDRQENPEIEITDAFLAHGTDWALFEYNPYGKSNDISGFTNPNQRRLSDDWAKIIGVGDINLETEDVMDTSVYSGMIQYRNYPSEGYNSFGKKYDKRWVWQGNTWVPSDIN
jgi:hypothetical protein